jgi:electron transport complex protein RnfC
MKKCFIGCTKPKLEYPAVGVRVEPEKIAAPKTATLFFKGTYNQKDKVLLKVGDKVKTGQKLCLFKDSDDYVISPITGAISGLSPYLGNFGQSFAMLTIDAAGAEEIDEAFRSVCAEPSLDAAKSFLGAAAGSPCFGCFSDPDKKIKTLVVCGTDGDLFVSTNGYVAANKTEMISKGISILKKITDVGAVIVALPKDLVKDAGAIGGASGAELREICSDYPSALPLMMMSKVLGQPVPAGKAPGDMGVCFLSAEAVASVGEAFTTGHIPLTKTITLIRKDLSSVMVQAKIGTPIGDIFTACGITVSEKDRIIIGGPMTGTAVYTEAHPVTPDTDAIMIQDSADVSLVSDYPCINCGECVRICPVNIPVNMLVRFLEAGQYEAAADEYDLYSCIECGLCSFVCVSKMPIFQYIRLAKYELSRTRVAEEA